MTYLDRLAQHWANSIKIAELGGANATQLAALADLSESEFGYRSDMRLKEGCFWSTKVDKDGDVVLSFIEPYTQTDAGSLPGRRVNVYVDHFAMVTVKDLDTGEQTVYDPYAEALGWGGTMMVWVLEDKLLKPLTEPSISVSANHDWQQLEAEVAETKEIFAPIWLKTELKILQNVSYWDGPIQGYMRLVGGGLFHFSQVYEDDVSGERVYALRQLTPWQAAKVHFNRVSWAVERWYNTAKITERARSQSWIRLKLRFGVEDLAANPISAYTLL